MSKSEDLSGLSVEGIDGRISDLRKELFFLRSEYKLARRVSAPHRLRDMRKTIARLLTEKSRRQHSLIG